jgi:hypothetical protein
MNCLYCDGTVYVDQETTEKLRGKDVIRVSACVSCYHLHMLRGEEISAIAASDYPKVALIMDEQRMHARVALCGHLMLDIAASLRARHRADPSLN